MMKYISIAILLILLIIVSTSVSITDKAVIKAGTKLTQDEIDHMRQSIFFHKKKITKEH